MKITKAKLKQIIKEEAANLAGVSALEPKFRTDMTDSEISELCKGLASDAQQHAAFLHFTTRNVDAPEHEGAEFEDFNAPLMENKKMKITKAKLKQIIKEELSKAEKERKEKLRIRNVEIEDELKDLEHK